MTEVDKAEEVIAQLFALLDEAQTTYSPSTAITALVFVAGKIVALVHKANPTLDTVGIWRRQFDEVYETAVALQGGR